MSAYVIFDIDIHDLARYQDFMTQAKPAIEAAGGKYLARGGEHKVLEGDWEPRRIVLFEFPSMAKAEEFYYGDVYQGLKTIRDACSSGRVVLVDGI
ncbi:DUF1330 domain-containing protein [Marinobacterium rhizophilum]|uniref:DUF1330 domain-containing protein n=1 Tax=Marinobacterium rhizophilum TaxID=420402 RepID=UPI00037CE569|nr:DUF1330 domain-containing protein [Marinobacterium rhizophilum]